MKIIKWLTPAFLLAVLLLALGELGARLFFAADISGRFEYGYHPDAGFDERSDGTVKLFRAGGRRFHPQSFQKRRPPGTFRVFVIGDSVMMPMRTLIDLPPRLPRSSDVDFFRLWGTGTNVGEVEQIVDRWWRQARLLGSTSADGTKSDTRFTPKEGSSRQKLAALDIELKDTPAGTVW